MNLLETLSNKFFYHLIGPLQPYFKRRLQEAQVNVKDGTIQDISFSPDALNKSLNNSPVIVDSFWIARVKIASYEPLHIEMHSPILSLKLNPDYVPSQTESTMSMTELAKSGLQVAEEVMKESVAVYLDSSKSANTEIIRRVINVLLHRVSVTVKGLVIALEVPDVKDPAKLDILRIRVDQIKISDSSQISSYTQALDLSYSSMYHLSEKKTAEITSFSIELFSIEKAQKTEMLHLMPANNAQPVAVSIPGTTKLHFELSPQPFQLNANVELDNVNVGLDGSQLLILGSISQQISAILSKATPPAQAPPPTSRANKVFHRAHHKPTEAPKVESPPPIAGAHIASPSTPSSSTQPKKILFSALEEDDEDDEDYSDALGDLHPADASADTSSETGDEEEDNSTAQLIQPIPTRAVSGEGNPSQMLENSQALVSSTHTPTTQPSLAMCINVRVSFLQMAVVPVPEVPNASIPVAGTPPLFTLDTILEPTKTSRHFVHIRFKDLDVTSTQDSHGTSTITANLAALAIHERYKLARTQNLQGSSNLPESLHNAGNSVYFGDMDPDGSYLTYHVLRIHHPHGYNRTAKTNSPLPGAVAPGAPGSTGSDGPSAWALKLRHSIEHRIPLTQVEIDQISVTLPGALPRLLSKVVDTLISAFPSGKSPSNASSSSSSPTSPKGGPTSPSGSDPSQALSTNPSSMNLGASDRIKFAGLVDSSSSSGRSSIASSSASIPRGGAAAAGGTGTGEAEGPAEQRQSPTNGLDEGGDTSEGTTSGTTTTTTGTRSGEEAPPPARQMVKVGHLFVMLRFPTTSHGSFDFPIYRREYLGVYLTDPSVNIFSRPDTTATSEDSVLIPPDSVEFTRLSMYLVQGAYDLTQLARSQSSGSSSTPAKRSSSGSLTRDPAAVKPKRFLKVLASAPDMKTEAITIQRRQRPDFLLLSAVTPQPMKLFKDYLQDEDAHVERVSSPSSASSGGSARSDPASATLKDPKFVSNAFEKAPFSAMPSKFEGEQQTPSAMDDATFDAFRSHVMATSDLAVTVTVHELEVELEKKEADLIQELLDSLSEPKDASESSSYSSSSSNSPNQVAPPKHPMTGIMSPFALDLRVDFASFQLGVDAYEYKFSNVETLRVLQVSQYLRAKKNFLVVQVGSLRLPSADPIPNAPPTLSKIPEFNDYERTNVLTVVMVTEALDNTNTSYPNGFSPSKPHAPSSPPTNSRMTLVIETERLALDHRLGAKWISDLGGFFVRDVPVDITAPKTEVLLFVNAKNSAVSVRGNILTNKELASQSQQSLTDPMLLLHFDKLAVRSQFLIPTDPAKNNLMEFHFRTTRVQTFLIDDKGRVWLKPYENAAVKTMRQYWLARGYSPAGYIESLFAKISLNSIALPSFALEINMNAKIDTTGDQVYTITQFLASIASPAPPASNLSGSSSSSSLATDSTGFAKGEIMFWNSPKYGVVPVRITSKNGFTADNQQKYLFSLLSDEKEMYTSHLLTKDDPRARPADRTGASPAKEVRRSPQPQEPDEEILTPAFAKSFGGSSQSQSEEEQYVLVKMTPEELKKRQAALKQEELLRAFKMAKRAPTQGPQVRFFAQGNGVASNKMPRPIENYKPSVIEAPPVQHTFKFSLSSENFVWRLREGVSLTDDQQQGAKYGEYHDVLSSSPGKYVDINLRALKVTFSSDELDQTDLNVRVQRFFFTSAMDPVGAKPFVDLDRGALSVAPHMLSLQLSSLYNLQDDSPALHASPAHRRLPPPSVASSSSSSSSSSSPSSARLAQSNPTALKSSDKPIGGHTTTGVNSAPASPQVAKEGQPSSILIFSILPLTIRVDIEALDFMRSFYATFTASKPPSISAPTHSPSSPPTKPGPHFHRVSISAVSLNLNVSAWAVRMDDAVIRLPSLYCRDVEGWEGVSVELSAVYSPLLYSSLFTFAGSLPVVRLALSVLGSVSNLVINPYAEYQQGRSAAAGAYGALTVGATSVASELLKFGAWVTSSAGDGLQYLESFWHTPEAARAAAPSSVGQGAQQGYASVARQVAAARDCLVVMPWKEYKRHQSVVGLVAGVAGAVPLAILKPVIGATHGLSEVMQGASNAIHVPGRTKDHIPSSQIPNRTSPLPPSPSRNPTSGASPSHR